MSIKVEP